jgi:hypothetical protein
MAIAYDNSGSGSITTGTSVTFSNNCSGSNRFIYGGATDNGANTVTMTVTKGGSATAMTLIARGAAGGLREATFYMIAPDAGVSSNVVASISSSGFIVAQTASYTGVHQTTPIDNSVVNAYNATASTTISQSITPVASGCWAIILGCFNANSGTVTAGANTTVRQSTVNASGLNGLADSNTTATAGVAYTLNLTGTSSGRSSQLATIAPSPATTNSSFLMFM